MELHTVLLLISGLLIVIGLTQPLATRLGLSPTVLLAVVGIAIGVSSVVLTHNDALARFARIGNLIVNLPISSEVFLYIFLPLLLFETALNIEVGHVLEDAGPILLLAIVAVLIATLAIGGALDAVARVPPVACYMLGAIVATTDPVAVVGIFRDLGAPARLSRLVEGESLLNDAAAITLFVLLLDILTGGHPPHVGHAAFTFVRSFGGGIVTGYIGARSILWLMRWLLDLRLAQVTLTLALPYLVYIIGEHLLHVSGVVATATAGLVMSAIGQPRMSPDDWRFLHDLWEQMAFWASSLIFVFASLLVPRMLAHVGWHDLELLTVLVFAALIARAIVLFGMLPILSALHLSRDIDYRFKTVIVWGGLRGAVTLALALSVTENSAISPEIQRFIGVLATGFVLFTLLINGTTLRILIRILKLDQLSPLDQALRYQVLTHSRERVSDTVKAMAVDYKFSAAVVSHALKSRGGEDLLRETAASAAEGFEDNSLLLGLIALASHERELVLSHFAERAVSGARVERLLTSLGQLIDRTRSGGAEEYIKGAQQIVDFSRSFRIAHFLHRRFSYDRPLVDHLADRFELLLVSRIVLEELDSYLRTKLSSLVGNNATATINGILRRRREMTTAALDALRQQYPAYAELLECRILEKIWLRREEMEYRALFDDGVVGPELYFALRREVNQLRAAVEVRPLLDLGLETRALVSKVPIFAGLTEEQLDSIARLLRPRFAVPGERLIRDGGVADAMYFLSSGSVQVHVVGTKINLGPGDFFGEIALVTGQRRQGDVDAIGYCQLLVLSRDAYRDFLRRNPLLQEHIGAVANARVLENRKAVNKNAERL